MSADTDKALAAVMPACCDHPGVTLREYLGKLLETLLEEDEDFSGKRPFGNSGWLGDIAHAVVAAGVLVGVINSDGDLESYDKRALMPLLMACHFDIFNGVRPGMSEKDANRLAKLDALERGGVDNWEGYDFSLEEWHKGQDE